MRLNFYSASLAAAIFAKEVMMAVTALSIDRIRFSTGEDCFDPTELVPKVS